MNQGYANPYAVSAAPATERAEFIRKTYLHLSGAIAAFVVLEYFLLGMEWSRNLAISMTSSWLLVIIAFMAVSWIADKWAMSSTSKGMQYAGLGLFIVAEAIIFMPLLLMATLHAEDVIGKAAIVTLTLVAALTAVVMITRKDFSFLRGALMIGGFIALGTIVAGILFKFDLGLFFSAAMCVFASASILYTTSNIVHHYRTDQHVAAALALFSGVALLFWYILRIFMHRD